jgi:hypothetical protein
MDCKEFQNYLFRSDEREISPETHNAMDWHAMGCESCSLLQDEFHLIERAIMAEKALEPPSFAVTRIIQRLENEQDKKIKVPNLFLRPALATLLIAAALVTGFLVGNHGTIRKSRTVAGANQIEILRSELYVVDFVEEDNTLLTNY